MTLRMKYINFDGLGLIIFGPNIQHSSMAMMINDKPISAGHIQIIDDRVHTIGKSESLGLTSDPQDATLFNMWYENRKRMDEL